MIEMKNRILPIDLGGVNSYLVEAEEGFVLVDTGGHLVLDKNFDNRRQRLTDALEKAGCTPGRLRLIVLTHGDNDHAANAAYLRQTLQAPIALHPADLPLVVNPDLPLLMGSFRYRSLVLRLVFRLMKSKITLVTRKTLEDFEAFQPDIALEDGMNLNGYGIEARVISLPGHTPGSVGLLFRDGSLLSGDTLVNNKKPAGAPNAADFKALSQSITRLKGMDIYTVYPGHGMPFSFRELL
ncbi:MAG: hypothetical protein K0Q90_1680 [Paenibacillaceae bacterium]|nr:hypothetical protein [Paenibacillaceae bacterium]